MNYLYLGGFGSAPLSAIPEPDTYALPGSGIAAMWFARRRISG